eukprot:Em0018g412a
MLAIVIPAAIWGPQWRATKQVACCCDNAAVVAALSSRSCKADRRPAAQGPRLAVSDLDGTLRFYYAQGLAESTHRTYQSGMRRFYAFCDTYSIPSPFPVSECTLCYFTTFLANNMLSAQTIKTYLLAVHNTQISLGFPDPRAQTAMPRLERIQAGIRRVLATRGKKKRSRLPITPTVLEGLKKYWAESTDDNRQLYWAAAALCYFGFFRLGELLTPSDSQAQLNWGDITFNHAVQPTMIKVHLSFAKCDQFGRGTDIYIGLSGNVICPVAADPRIHSPYGPHYPSLWTPLPQPMDPTTPLVQPMDPTTPLVQPMDPTTPLVQPMDPTTPLVQPMDPTTPLVQPMDPTTPLVQPMDPTTPLVQPMDPTTPLVQPMDPTTPLVQPMDPTTPLVQPMDPTIPLVQPAYGPHYPTGSAYGPHYPTGSAYGPHYPTGSAYGPHYPTGSAYGPHYPTGSAYGPHYPTGSAYGPHYPTGSAYGPLPHWFSLWTPLSHWFSQPMDPTTPLVQPMDPTTPLVQPMDPTIPLPMDVSINRPFKQAMREIWVTWFSKHTIHGNLTQPTRQDAIDWVSAAWNSIKSETIVESFKCCGITASVDGSDDTKMFRRVPRVIIESDDESEVGDDDSDGMVTGDDFEGFDADDDLFEITLFSHNWFSDIFVYMMSTHYTDNVKRTKQHRNVIKIFSHQRTRKDNFLLASPADAPTFTPKMECLMS